MEHRWSFSTHAQEYMLAYHVLANWESLDDSVKGTEPLPETSASLLDKVIKERHKSHRTIRHDSRFVNRVMADTAIPNALSPEAASPPPPKKKKIKRGLGRENNVGNLKARSARHYLICKLIKKKVCSILLDQFSSRHGNCV